MCNSQGSKKEKCTVKNANMLNGKQEMPIGGKKGDSF